MNKLAMITALEGRSLKRDGISVTENTRLGLIRLQTFYRTPGAVEAFARQLGMVLPGPGETRAEEKTQLFWTAPGEWVLAVPADSEREVLGSLRAKLDGLLAVLSVMTDSRVVLDLSGEATREVLSRGSTLDWHPTRFGAGHCVVTRFAGVPVMLACPYGGDMMLLFADRTLTHYLMDWLEAASIDFGGDPCEGANSRG